MKTPSKRVKTSGHKVLHDQESNATFSLYFGTMLDERLVTEALRFHFKKTTVYFDWNFNGPPLQPFKILTELYRG